MRITIYRNNVYAGEGRFSSYSGRILDCSAMLGPTDEQSEETYQAIEDAIAGGWERITRPDGEYTWSVEP